jgi:hypothetical protein
MKCLSLWQPWASLLVAGAKLVETRGWLTAHRGPLLIHATKHWTPDLWGICQAEPFHSTLCRIGFPRQIGKPDRGLPLGCIIGRVDVVACVSTSIVDVCPIAAFVGWTAHLDIPRPRVTISAAERAFGNYGPGRFAFLCENPVRFDKPVPCRGRQMMFNVEGV